MEEFEWEKVLDETIEKFKHIIENLKYDGIVNFCIKNEELRSTVKSYIKIWASRRRLHRKSEEISMKKKDLGNLKFREREYPLSLDLFTESIAFAPKNTTIFPLAYANRSLALQCMGYNFECVQDINVALEAGYPKEKSDKLYLRKASCCVSLGDAKMASDVITEVIGLDFPDDVLRAVQDELSNLKVETNSIFNPGFYIRMPKVTGGENDNFASASKYISVHYSKEKGRHVVANHEINVGDVLFVEKPFAHVMFAKACHACCRNTEAPIFCFYCMDGLYCSAECRDSFWEKIHIHECGFSELFQSVGIAHLSLRIILEASSTFEELKAKLIEIDINELEEGIVNYRSNDYDSVFNLVTHADKFQPFDLFQYAMTALLLTIYMKDYTKYFTKTPGNESLKLFYKIVLRHILQLICNGHAIINTILLHSEETILSESEERIGTAIYPSASMMNHSCDPSVIYSFHKNYLVVRAAKNIKPGEEVFNCYGPNAKRMRRAERLEILREQYFFDCKCGPCLAKYDIQDRFLSYKCINCEGPAFRKPNPEDPNKTVCLDCGHIWTLPPSTTKREIIFYSLVNEASRLMMDDICFALEKYLEAWKTGRNMFYKYNTDLYQVSAAVGECLTSLKDYRRCLLFMKFCVQCVEAQFGPYSMELAKELKSFAKILTNYSVRCEERYVRRVALEALANYKRAKEIASLFYGPDHQDLKEFDRDKGILEAFAQGKDTSRYVREIRDLEEM